MRSRRFALIVGLGAGLSACGILQSYDGYSDGVRPVDEAGANDGPSGGDSDSAGGDGNVTADGAMDAGADGDAAIPANGALYIYTIGGRVRDGALTASADVQFLRAYNDAGVDLAWSHAPALPSDTFNHGTVTSGDAVIVLGGTVGNVATGAVYSARVDPTNGLTPWVTQPFPIPTPRTEGLVASVPGHVYALGLGGTGVSYATLSATGDVGAWTTTSALPVIHGAGAFATAGSGYVYVLGGETSQTRIDYAKIMLGGALGAWTNATPRVLPGMLANAQAFVSDDRLYIFGGFLAGVGAVPTVSYASIAADGSLSDWTTSANPLPSKRHDHGAAYYPLLRLLVTTGGSADDVTQLAEGRSTKTLAAGDIQPWLQIPSLALPRTQHTNAMLVK